MTKDWRKNMFGFVFWTIVALVFVVIGIVAFLSEKPMGFFSNAEKFEVTDVKGYNRAVGILWCVYGIIMVLLGLPLLAGQNSPYILLTIVGVMIETIALVMVYVLVIEKKYRKK